MNENDLRVLRTRRLLQDALLALANEQPFADISIRDVTRRAQVGYKTFFRHYDSIESLLQAIIDSFLHDFEKVARPSTQPSAIAENTRYVLNVARENKQLFLVVFNSPKSMQFLQPVIDHVYRDSRQMAPTPDMPEALIGHHFAMSMLSLTKWWLENDSTYTVDQMVDYIMRLIIQPIGGLQTSADTT